jgi:hypothetical protein
MSSARKITAERETPQGSGTRETHERLRPFLGLFAAAFGALFTAWLMHAYLRGIAIVWHFGRYTPINWHLAGSDAAWIFTVILMTLAAVGLALWAWHVADNRKPALRHGLAGATGIAVVDFAVQVGVGPARWWSFFGLVAWWVIAGMWTLPRLDVSRRDPRTGEPQEVKPDPVEEKMGLVGAKYTPKQYTLDGKVVRTDIEVQLPRGETLDVLDKAAPMMESLADSAGVGAPPGLSSVQAGEGASRATVSLVHVDILKDGVEPEPPEFRPDGSRYTIDERPLLIGRCMDLEPATETMRSTQGVIGVTGGGKSQYARKKIATISTRSWVAPPLYFDKVKGKQTVAPVVNALGIILLSNDRAPHVEAIKALKAIVEYRADLFGELGYDEWEPGLFDHDGQPVPLLPYWFEECDELLKLAPGDMTFLAGKARSTGVVPVWSLQRPDHKMMPTELRANIVNWTVFGITPGDDYTATMALSDDLISKGARPFWGDTKPGYHYRTERETPERRWTIVRRVANDSREELWAITSQYGPGMTPLDGGTIAATGGWYEQALEETKAIKATMTAKGMTVTVRQDTPVKARPAPTGGEGGFDDDDSDDAYTEDGATARQEVDEEVTESLTDGSIPDNPDPGESTLDADVPIEQLSPDEEDDSWEDEIGGKPSVHDRPTARAAFWRTLFLLSQDESLRSPQDPALTLFQVDTLVDRWPFRSRPWFSRMLADVIVGEEEIPSEYGMTLLADEDDVDGHYQLYRIATAVEPPPINAA